MAMRLEGVVGREVATFLGEKTLNKSRTPQANPFIYELLAD
jgi:hypothetical protein